MQLSEKVIGVFCVAKLLTPFNCFQSLACFFIGNFHAVMLRVLLRSVFRIVVAYGFTVYCIA